MFPFLPRLLLFDWFIYFEILLIYLVLNLEECRRSIDMMSSDKNENLGQQPWKYFNIEIHQGI